MGHTCPKDWKSRQVSLKVLSLDPCSSLSTWTTFIPYQIHFKQYCMQVTQRLRLLSVHLPVWWLVYKKYLMIFRLSHLISIRGWQRTGFLSFLIKTKYVIFHTSGCKMDDISLDIRIENNSIERIREFNFLGWTINETMTWSSHVRKIASKIGRTVAVLHKLKHFLPKDVL